MSFWNKYKKIVYIILFVGIVILLGYLILNTFFGVGQEEPQVQPDDQINIGGLFPAEEGSSSGGVVGPGGQLDPSGDINTDPDGGALVPASLIVMTRVQAIPPWVESLKLIPSLPDQYLSPVWAVMAF